MVTKRRSNLKLRDSKTAEQGRLIVWVQKYSSFPEILGAKTWAEFAAAVNLWNYCIWAQKQGPVYKDIKAEKKLFINPFPILYYLVIELDLDKMEEFCF